MGDKQNQKRGWEEMAEVGAGSRPHSSVKSTDSGRIAEHSEAAPLFTGVSAFHKADILIKMLPKDTNQCTESLHDGLFSYTQKTAYDYRITALGYQLTKAANELHCYQVR